QRLEEASRRPRSPDARPPVARPLRRRTDREARPGQRLVVTATEKLPPFDIEAEEAVIASLLVDPDAISRVEPVVSSEDFYRDQNRWAYDAASRSGSAAKPSTR